MNIEEMRDLCLSLGEVTEKCPFGRFAARYDSILAFYVEGHMFCFFDIDDFSYVDVRSTPEAIAEMRERYTSVGHPLNRSLRYWIEVRPGGDMGDAAICDLVRRAYTLVRDKYRRR